MAARTSARCSGPPSENATRRVRSAETKGWVGGSNRTWVTVLPSYSAGGARSSARIIEEMLRTYKRHSGSAVRDAISLQCYASLLPGCGSSQRARAGPRSSSLSATKGEGLPWDWPWERPGDYPTRGRKRPIHDANFALGMRLAPGGIRAEIRKEAAQRQSPAQPRNLQSFRRNAFESHLPSEVLVIQKNRQVIPSGIRSGRRKQRFYAVFPGPQSDFLSDQKRCFD